MGRQKHTAEQVISKLREAEVLQAKGMSMEEMLRQLGVSDATYYKWRKEYGGLRVDQAKRLKELEQENSRLRKVVSDLSIDNAILKEAAREIRHHLPQPERSRKNWMSQNDECVVCWTSHDRHSDIRGWPRRMRSH